MTDKWEADKSYIEWRYEQAKRARERQLTAKWLDDLKHKVWDYPTDSLEQGLAAYKRMFEEEWNKPYCDDVHDALWFYCSVIEIYQKELDKREAKAGN